MFDVTRISKKHLWLIVSVAAMTLPFLDKAVHMDDPVNIYVARQILQDPAHPFDFQLNWFGITTEALQSHWHPPLFSYYLSFFMFLFGESEIALHGCLAIFSLVAVYSVFFLARRFTDRPLQATLLIILSPAFFVSASTLMPDVAVFACTSAAMALFIHGLDSHRLNSHGLSSHGLSSHGLGSHGLGNDKRGILVLSGILLAAACLIKYSAALLFGLLWFYAYQRGKARNTLLPLGLAFVIVNTWVFFHYQASGLIHPFLALELESTIGVAQMHKLVSLISYTGASLLIAGCFSFPEKRWRHIIMGLALALGLFVAAHATRLPWLSVVLFFLLTVNGVYGLGLILAGWAGSRDSGDRDTVFLRVWFGVTLVFVPTVIAFNAMRHVLIFLVPMVLLLFRSCRAGGNFDKIFPANLAAVFLVSLGISIGDYNYANTYREFAATVVKEASGSNPGSTVWFRTHWGFQYYMENLGARFLEEGNAHEVRKGDWFVDTLNAHHNRVNKDSLKRVKTYHAASVWPVRLMDVSLGAGWYAQMWGPLAFALDRTAPLETFTLYQVTGLQKDMLIP